MDDMTPEEMKATVGEAITKLVDRLCGLPD